MGFTVKRQGRRYIVETITDAYDADDLECLVNTTAIAYKRIA